MARAETRNTGSAITAVQFIAETAAVTAIGASYAQTKPRPQRKPVAPRAKASTSAEGPWPDRGRKPCLAIPSNGLLFHR